mgnify:FL=1
MANKTLIQGQAIMNQAGVDNSIDSFTKAFKDIVKVGMEQKEKQNAEVDGWLTKLGSIENINLIEEANRGPVTEFLRTNRSTYTDLAKSYAKTKDTSTLDEMNAIKFKFQKLNTQLLNLQEDRKLYAEAGTEGVLMVGDKYNGQKYIDAYTNKSAFTISKDADIMFGKETFESMDGQWDIKNTKSVEYSRKILAKSQNQAMIDAKNENGSTFQKSVSKAGFVSDFEAQGNDGIKSWIGQDIAGDLDAGGAEITLSFADQWDQGILNDPNGVFYTQDHPKGSGTDWMYKPENASKVRNMAAEYMSNVEEMLYNDSYKEFEGTGRSSKENNDNIASVSMINKTLQKPSKLSFDNLKDIALPYGYNYIQDETDPDVITIVDSGSLPVASFNLNDDRALIRRELYNGLNIKNSFRDYSEIKSGANTVKKLENKTIIPGIKKEDEDEDETPWWQFFGKAKERKNMKTVNQNDQ